jgi:hypothetical protein
MAAPSEEKLICDKFNLVFLIFIVVVGPFKDTI